MADVNSTPSIFAQRKNAYRRVMVLIAAVVALFALPASAQAAPNTECTGTIGAVLIEGKIVVPAGATCTLEGTTVTDSIIVGAGSSLNARSVETLLPATVSIQASGAASVVVTGTLPPGELEVPEELRTRLLGSVQAVGGGTVTISDTELGGGLQVLDNSGPVLITNSFVEGALQLNKNKGAVSVTDSFLGEGVEISETTGDVTFTANTSDESDLTIQKTNGDVTVESNPSLGENFEVTETTGQLSVLDNTINDNAEIANNAGGAIVAGNTVGDNLALFKITGGPIEIALCDPLNQECTPAEAEFYAGALIVVGNTVGDNIEVLEIKGDVTFAANLVEGTATIDKTTGAVTADGNTTGYSPPSFVPAVLLSGSFLVSEASEGASVSNNVVTGDLGVTENSTTTVSDNTVGVGIAVSKNKGGTEVSANRAGGDITCIDNDPAATGGGNLAGTDGTGSLTGQCAGL